MFRALWIKQWVQLRTLRWVGLGLGIVLPFFLWAGAAAGKRGWLGFNLGNYDLVTLFGEALPAFSTALWGLLAVMFAAQTFAGDRADGTDRFLLERPVPRRRTWLARGLASLASSLLVVLGNTLYITALVALVQDGSGTQVYTKIMTALWVGTGLAVLGTIGGMAAGEMVRTPLQAVLIGGVLAALPIGAVTFFASAFEMVWIGRVHLAFIVTPILPIAMILSSYRAGCLGEPAGRGRIQRGAVVLTAALVITPVLFAATTPFVLRALCVGGWTDAVAAHADRLVVLGGSYGRVGGWMIDTAKKEKIRFLRPPVRSTAWNDDGSIVAVIHQWGVLGWLSGDRHLRVEREIHGARLVLAAGDGEEILSRYFEIGVSAIVSPDAQRFLVKQWDVEHPHASSGLYGQPLHGIERLFLCDGSEWTELNSLVPDLEGRVWINWGGPNTLVLTRNGDATAVADAAAGAEWTPVLGRWP